MRPRLALPPPDPTPMSHQVVGKGLEAWEAVPQAQESRAAGSVAVKSYLPEPVREFQVSVRGFHHGQSDLTLVALQDGVRVGHLDFSRFGEDISVQMLFVEEGARRQGIGTAMLQELQRQFLSAEINLGVSTEEGSALIGSISFREVPSPEACLFDELARLLPERDHLQALCDESLDPKWHTEEGRAAFLREMEHFDEVHDRLWELEQATWGKAPLKRLIVLPEDPPRVFGPAQVETEAFRWWFGEGVPGVPQARSRVVDREGRPMRVFHGTRGAFRSFDPGQIGSGDPGFHGAGFYFTEDPALASDYSSSLGGGAVMPVYLSLRRPLEVPRLAPREAWRTNYLRLLAEAGVPEGADPAAKTEALIRAGYDGVIVWGEKGEMKEIVAFFPSQIKSAICNCGTFDPASDDLCS